MSTLRKCCPTTYGEPHGRSCMAETTLPPVLTQDMQKQLRKAGQMVVRWTAERDRLVKDAVQQGGSLREVGDAVGLTHTAVKFIAHGRPQR